MYGTSLSVFSLFFFFRLTGKKKGCSRLALTNFGDFQILAKNWQIYKIFASLQNFGILTNFWNFDKFLTILGQV